MGDKADEAADPTTKRARPRAKTTASEIAHVLRPFAKKTKSFVKYAENKDIKKAKHDVDKIKEAVPLLAKLRTYTDLPLRQSDLEAAVQKLVKDRYIHIKFLYIYTEREREIPIYIYIYVCI